jgi:TetR/AcrR family transcriptional repressor of bet genes
MRELPILCTKVNLFFTFVQKTSIFVLFMTTRQLDPVFQKLFETQPSKGDLKRFELIRAAIRCIGSRGIEDTTFETIAREAKTQKSHVAYYFPDKRKLIEASIRYIIGTAQDVTVKEIQKESTLEGRLVAMARAALLWAETQPEQASVLLLFHYYCALNPSYRGLQTSIREAGSSRVCTMLSEAYPKRSSSELSDAAQRIHWIMSGATLDQLTTEQRKPVDRIKQVSAAVRRELRALASGPSGNPRKN